MENRPYHEQDHFQVQVPVFFYDVVELFFSDPAHNPGTAGASHPNERLLISDVCSRHGQQYAPDCENNDKKDCRYYLSMDMLRVARRKLLKLGLPNVTLSEWMREHALQGRIVRCRNGARSACTNGVSVMKSI